jgi:hypothetical protein
MKLSQQLFSTGFTGLLVTMLAACASDSPGLLDAATQNDAATDATTVDSLAPAADAQPETNLPPLPLGTISGACGVLDDVIWSGDSPLLVRNSLDLGSAEFDAKKLSTGGQEVIDDGNRGGNSLYSEAVAYEALYYCEGAKLLKTETEIDYVEASGKKSDLLLEIDQRKIGVSVTRAYHYPPGEPYLESEAMALLQKKLAALPSSRANATAEDRWERSILHILAFDSQHADLIESAWSQIDATTKAKSIVVLTVTEGNDDFIY